jgi:hypothetical protein
MDCYLSILVSLVAFFCAILLYVKYNYPQDNFAIIPDVFKPPMDITPVVVSKDIHYLDTRYRYPTLPPVNPNIKKSILLKVIPANSDLYSPLGNIGSPTNQLEYSGGTSEIIKIPLQMNVPYDEQLRSQEILITDYNKIKYSK